MNFVTKDSGQRQTWPSGAQRDTQAGKGRYDLLHPWIIKRDAGLYERGAAKYDAWNWTKGIPASRYLDSLLRHAFQYAAGDRTEDHLAAIRFNAGGIMFNEEAVQRGLLPPEILDIPVWDSQAEALKNLAAAVDKQCSQVLAAGRLATFRMTRGLAGDWAPRSSCTCADCMDYYSDPLVVEDEDPKIGGTSSEED